MFFWTYIGNIAGQIRYVRCKYRLKKAFEIYYSQIIIEQKKSGSNLIRAMRQYNIFVKILQLVSAYGIIGLI